MKILEVIIICSLVVLGALFIEFPVADNKIIAPSPTPRPSLVKEDVWPTLSPKATIIPSPKKAALPFSPPVNKPKATISGSEVFNLINTYRSSNGLPGLSVSDELCHFAQIRANFVVADNEKAFKESSTGNHVGMSEQISFDEYSGNTVGENQNDTSLNHPNYGANIVVEGWRNSPAHNALLLRTEKNGYPITKACVATATNTEATVTIFLIGDK